MIQHAKRSASRRLPPAAILAAFTLALAGAAALPAATVLTSSDGVIRNSLCVGFDCPSNPSFSDTTILLMENNTRIKFDDTSTAASFPNNDWELEANSNLNGGPNRFTLNDCGNSSQGGCADDPVFAVEAGVRANALYVDSGGDVGIGTGVPVGDLHIVTGNTPFVRLEQDGSSGFAPQTWDVAGNETNFFIRDVTSGSRLPLRIRPGAGSSSIEIRADNQVQFAGLATNGDADLHVKSNNNQDAIMGLGVTPNFSSGSGENAFIFGYNGAGAIGRGFIGTRPTSSGTGGEIQFNVRNTLEMTLSDTGLNVVDQISVGGTPLNVPDYVFDPDYALMPIAELARFVSTEKHLPGVPSEAQIKAEGLDLGGFQMRLLEKVEELVLYTVQQEERIDRQQATIDAQEGTIAALAARLAALEADD